MERVRLVHGNGGRFSHELTDRFILKYFTNDLLAPLHDGAQFPVTAGRMAFSTDSYVVQPAFFPGGNIGKLAVCGTVNDLAMNGAIPQYLSFGLWRARRNSSHYVRNGKSRKCSNCYR